MSFINHPNNAHDNDYDGDEDYEFGVVGNIKNYDGGGIIEPVPGNDFIYIELNPASERAKVISSIGPLPSELADLYKKAIDAVTGDYA